MTEQTDDNDGLRPLTPDERNFVRLMRTVVDDPEKAKKLKRLLDNEPEITLVAENYSHLSWGGKMLFRVAVWLAGIVGGMAAYQTIKAWAGIK